MGSNEKYTGLSNQGATCYMNSLLQTLFMTPEFLYRIYKWRWDSSKHNSKKDCIPYQLQLMFAKLHIKRSSVVETTGLTRSFQWDMRESLQQHDVQEFCRVLFDAIEESVKGTEQEKMITELYEGLYVDYVKCLRCGHESNRQDKFLDLSLAVRYSQDEDYNDSLEKALENFLKPDMLVGDNLYSCDVCNQKTEAKKGLKFSKLPYILALQLKRFDLDCGTMQRKKINDKVTFPFVLNMSRFMNEGEDCNSIYELFSIMIHSGSALGGHYYAYIKSFESGKWFNFNDSQVKEIQFSDIENVFGGIIGNGVYGANAYLLMYRQYCDKNIKKVDEKDIPFYLLEEISKEEENKIKENKEKEDRMMIIDVKIFFKGNFYIVRANKYISIDLFKKKCLKDLKLNYDPEDVRLRVHSIEKDQFLECFTNKEMFTLDHLNITSYSCLAIETKTADEEFLPYSPSYLNIKVCIWRDYMKNSNSSFNDLIINPYRIQIVRTSRLKDLLNFLSSYFRISFDNIRLWKKSPYISKLEIAEITDPRHLNTKVLMLKIFDGCLLLLEDKIGKSNWKEIVDSHRNTFIVYFNDPKDQNLEYSNRLLLEDTTTLKYLKIQLGAELGIGNTEFSVRKGSKKGQELPENEQSLCSYFIHNNCTLHVKLKPASLPNHFSVSLYYVSLNSQGYDYMWYKFFYLYDLNVSQNISLQDLKEVICRSNSNYFPSLILTPNNIRLREKSGLRILRVLNDKDRLNWFEEYRNIEIAVEEFLEPNGCELVCTFRKWSPSTWDLSPPVQLFVNKYSGLEEIAKNLEITFQVPAQNLQATRITYLNNFIRGDLPDMDWVPLNSDFIAGKPFFVESDGATFV
jgi:ubiquitin C-terminal hydrolase